MGENRAKSKELLDTYEPMRCNLSSSYTLVSFHSIFDKKNASKNDLIVMPFNKILIITNVNIVLFPHFWSTIWGGGSSQQGNCISKKIQETTIYPGKLMKTIYHIEKAKVIISLFVWLTHISICTYLCYTKSKFEVVCFWKNNSQHKLEKQT